MMPRSIIIFLLISFNAQAEREYYVNAFSDNTVFECTVSSIFVKSEQKHFTPPKQLKYFTIAFVNKMDEVIIETKNLNSIYSYSHFVDLQNDWLNLKKGDLGVNYTLLNSEAENYLDIFENGKVVWEVNSNINPNLNAVSIAYCPDLRLAIKRIK